MNSKLPNRFNIRAYALIIQNNKILVSTERIKGEMKCKFPGGGIVPGEGIIDGLKRELIEEIGVETSKINHFYTTDFFQQSAYNSKDQLIAVYYLVSTKEKLKEDKIIGLEEDHEFTWIPIKGHGSILDFPIDKLVYSKLQ